MSAVICLEGLHTASSVKVSKERDRKIARWSERQGNFPRLCDPSSVPPFTIFHPSVFLRYSPQGLSPFLDRPYRNASQDNKGIDECYASVKYEKLVFLAFESSQFLTSFNIPSDLVVQCCYYMKAGFRGIFRTLTNSTPSFHFASSLSFVPSLSDVSMLNKLSILRRLE